MDERLHILSPFDNAVIQRDRLQTLFDFEYRLECYVPAAKRQYGYFCLPLLYRGELIGRMDCKAHRNSRLLELKALYFKTITLDETLLAAFVRALRAFAGFVQCDTIELNHADPKPALQAIRKALLLAS